MKGMVEYVDIEKLIEVLKEKGWYVKKYTNAHRVGIYLNGKFTLITAIDTEIGSISSEVAYDGTIKLILGKDTPWIAIERVTKINTRRYAGTGEIVSMRFREVKYVSIGTSIIDILRIIGEGGMRFELVPGHPYRGSY